MAERTRPSGSSGSSKEDYGPGKGKREGCKIRFYHSKWCIPNVCIWSFSHSWSLCQNDSGLLNKSVSGWVMLCQRLLERFVPLIILDPWRAQFFSNQKIYSEHLQLNGILPFQRWQAGHSSQIMARSTWAKRHHNSGYGWDLFLWQLVPIPGEERLHFGRDQSCGFFWLLLWRQPRWTPPFDGGHLYLDCRG